MPPSLEVLEERLIKRGKDNLDDIKARMSVSSKEIMDIERSDFVENFIINDNLENSNKKLKSIILNNYPYLSDSHFKLGI